MYLTPKLGRTDSPYHLMKCYQGGRHPYIRGDLILGGRNHNIESMLQKMTLVDQEDLEGSRSISPYWLERNHRKQAVHICLVTMILKCFHILEHITYSKLCSNITCSDGGEKGYVQWPGPLSLIIMEMFLAISAILRGCNHTHLGLVTNSIQSGILHKQDSQSGGIM